MFSRSVAAAAAILMVITVSIFTLAQESSSTEVRVNARQLADGRIEFALQQRDGAGWGERILTAGRFFPANISHDRWIPSSSFTIITGPPPDEGEDLMEEEEPEQTQHRARATVQTSQGIATPISLGLSRPLSQSGYHYAEDGGWRVWSILADSGHIYAACKIPTDENRDSRPVYLWSSETSAWSEVTLEHFADRSHIAEHKDRFHQWFHVTCHISLGSVVPESQAHGNPTQTPTQVGLHSPSGHGDASHSMREGWWYWKVRGLTGVFDLACRAGGDVHIWRASGWQEIEASQVLSTLQLPEHRTGYISTYFEKDCAIDLGEAPAVQQQHSPAQADQSRSASAQIHEDRGGSHGTLSMSCSPQPAGIPHVKISVDARGWNPHLDEDGTVTVRLGGRAGRSHPFDIHDGGISISGNHAYTLLIDLIRRDNLEHTASIMFPLQSGGSFWLRFNLILMGTSSLGDFRSCLGPSVAHLLGW